MIVRKRSLVVRGAWWSATRPRRLDLPDPPKRLHEVRFHQKAPGRAFLTCREADVLLGTMVPQTGRVRAPAVSSRRQAATDPVPVHASHLAGPPCPRFFRQRSDSHASTTLRVGLNCRTRGPVSQK